MFGFFPSSYLCLCVCLIHILDHGYNSFTLIAVVFDVINCTIDLSILLLLDIWVEFRATVDSAALKILGMAFGAHVDTFLLSL